MIGEPGRIPAAFAAAWNARDADALAALFDEDAEFVNVVGLWWHDREAIRRAHAYGLTRIFAHSTLRIGATRVKFLGTEVAVVHARMYLEGQSPVPEVSSPGPRMNIFTFVAHR
ncbi:MAG: SgcJ/EcaC family oxidoreductase, partial [Gemmatimonadota bacterium]|nr:SgcJ/EcaC family oxidoreductase [Gemmatimonadota bacterium]